MFIGHFAVGFALKRAAPRADLGWLLAASEFLDLIWPIFLLAGWEWFRIEPGITKFTPLDFVHYPISHSMVTAIGWSIAFAAVYFALRRYAAGAIAAGVGVFSHWVLDAVVHRPDLPLYPGGPVAGLGLWNSIPETLIVEGAMFAVGVWIYARSTRPVDRAGTYAFWSLVAFLVVVYLVNSFGPPPPSENAVAWSALLLWLVPLWGWWIDRHRETSAL